MSGAYLIAFVANFLAPQGSLVSHLIIPRNNAPSVSPPWVQEYIFICVPNSGVLQPQPFQGFLTGCQRCSLFHMEVDFPNTHQFCPTIYLAIWRAANGEGLLFQEKSVWLFR